MIHRRAFSSTARRCYEYLAIIPDKPGVMAKRLQVRPQHFQDAKALYMGHTLQAGGGLAEEHPNDGEQFQFNGSMFSIQADSKSKVMDVLKQDVYYRSGVWDLDKVQIYAILPAFREMKRHE